MAEEHHKHDKKNTLEWSVFTISLLSVISLLAFLTYQTITYNPSSPDLVVEYKHDPSQNAPHRYHITIRNKGQETAEEVQIELILEKNGRELEKATMQIPFAPQESKREGWVSFSKDPAKADTLYSRVVSYKRP